MNGQKEAISPTTPTPKGNYCSFFFRKRLCSFGLPTPPYSHMLARLAFCCVATIELACPLLPRKNSVEQRPPNSVHHKRPSTRGEQAAHTTLTPYEGE